MHSMLSTGVLLVLGHEREMRLRRTSLQVSEHRQPRRVVRRWIGRQMVRFGTRLAGEPTMRPARAR